MSSKLDTKQAEKLIKIAKNSINSYFDNKEYKISAGDLKEFSEERGVFVSLYVEESLIGCIGFPEPIMSLAEGVARAARGAAFEDPRFPLLKKEQFDKVRIELSVLTKPEEIKVDDYAEYAKKIKIGEDGLVIRDDLGDGLLLPQVATELGWKAEEFLDNTCRKAGLEPGCWKNIKKNVFKFQAQIFTEEKGRIVEKKLY